MRWLSVSNGLLHGSTLANNVIPLIFSNRLVHCLNSITWHLVTVKYEGRFHVHGISSPDKITNSKAAPVYGECEAQRPKGEGGSWSRGSKLGPTS